jgi:hypothetical protein
MAKGDKIDVSTYETAKGYLKAALEQMIGAGRSVKEFGDFALDKFGDTFIPYLDEFSQDIKNGSIKIKGLGESAKTTLFGRHVTLEERERMIREASYLRSERRGFLPGYEESDWLIAEREVEERLAKEAGLVERGRNALDSTSAIIEQELDDIKQVVTSWLENNPTIGETLSKVGIKTTAGKQPAKSPSAKEDTVENEPVTTANSEAANKGKPAAKQTVTKKAAKTETATTTTAKKKAVKKAAARQAAPGNKSTTKKATSKKAVKKKTAKKKAANKKTTTKK